MINSPKVLKIGLDYHGVITQNPQLFASLAQELIKRGHEVHIITGGPCQAILPLLNNMGFPYTDSFAILDHYEGLGKVECLKDGGFHVDDMLWDSAKADYCKTKEIDLHIDDSPIYVRYFKTPYCHFDAKSNSCSVAGKHCLAFSEPVAKIVDEIEKIYLK